MEKEYKWFDEYMDYVISETEKSNLTLKKTMVTLLKRIRTEKPHGTLEFLVEHAYTLNKNEGFKIHTYKTFYMCRENNIDLDTMVFSKD